MSRRGTVSGGKEESRDHASAEERGESRRRKRRGAPGESGLGGSRLGRAAEVSASLFRSNGGDGGGGRDCDGNFADNWPGWLMGPVEPEGEEVVPFETGLTNVFFASRDLRRAAKDDDELAADEDPTTDAGRSGVEDKPDKGGSGGSSSILALALGGDIGLLGAAFSPIRTSKSDCSASH